MPTWTFTAYHRSNSEPNTKLNSQQSALDYENSELDRCILLQVILHYKLIIPPFKAFINRSWTCILFRIEIDQSMFKRWQWILWKSTIHVVLIHRNEGRTARNYLIKQSFPSWRFQTFGANAGKNDRAQFIYPTLYNAATQ